jgi:hypothetical protein
MCWASFECSFKLSIVVIQCQFLLFLFLVSFVNVPTAVLLHELLAYLLASSLPQATRLFSVHH